MSPLGRDEVREFLAGEFPEASIDEAENGALLKIGERHPEVGPMTIQFDPDEITVFVGPTHCHFEAFDDSEPDEAVRAAIGFIREVLSDRVVLWSHLGAAGSYPAAAKSHWQVPWPVRRYLWSGPLPHG